MNDILSLDESWIKEFEETDKKFSDFYQEDIFCIKIHYIYVSKNGKLLKTIQEKRVIKTPNKVSREEIITMLKKNCHPNYLLLSILKYNIDIDCQDVREYCENPKPRDKGEFLACIKNIDEILFKRSITMFQDLNCLFFVFKEKDSDTTQKNKTKRVILGSTLKKRKTSRRLMF